MSLSPLRERQARKLRRLLREAHERNPFYRRKLDEAGFPKAFLREPEGEEQPLAALLEHLPLTTKSELERDQAAHPPYGTNLTYERGAYTRMHQTSGTTGVPLRWLDTPRSWQWFLECWKEVYRGAGLGRRDRVYFPFSFGPFIGFWAAFDAASQLGTFCLAGGGMSTAARLRAIAENEITFVPCTPTYALRMAEVAAAEGIDLRASAVRALIVAGEPGGSIEATRRRIEEAWNARVFDHCGMTETGAFGFECEANPGGLHIVEEEFVAEVLAPGAEDPVPRGERGELVITNLGRIGSPVIRYRTGDLIRAVEQACPCGRGSLRLEGGILGRLDDMVYIRGNNVYPSVIEAIVRRFPEVAEYRATVLQSGDMTDLKVELDPAADLGSAEASSLVERVSRRIRDALHFRATVTLVSPGTLPRFDMKARRFVRNRQGP